MNRRLQVVLSEPIAAQLRELAASTGEPPSTVAAHLVRSGVAGAANEGNVRRLRPVPTPIGPNSNSRARWLEPYGGDPSWRQEMWGAIVALHGRYPRHLEALTDGWWNYEAQVETLCALVTWRAEIDDGGSDPREEIAFHTQLGGYAGLLREHGGGVTRAWTPSAPPDGWAGR